MTAFSGLANDLATDLLAAATAVKDATEKLQHAHAERDKAMREAALIEQKGRTQIDQAAALRDRADAAYVEAVVQIEAIFTAPKTIKLSPLTAAGVVSFSDQAAE